MVEEESETYEEPLQIPELFYELGAKMKKLSTWFWITLIVVAVSMFFITAAGTVWGLVRDDTAMFVFIGVAGFFSLVMSCIGLLNLIVYWHYLVALKEIRDATGDPVFEKVYQYLLIGLIITIFNFGILLIVPFILNILVFMELEKWAIEMEKRLPTPEMKNISEGYNWLKIGTAVSICCQLALFVMPIAYAKIGKAYMAEYNSSKFGGFGVTQPYPFEQI